MCEITCDGLQKKHITIVMLNKTSVVNLPP